MAPIRSTFTSRYRDDERENKLNPNKERRFVHSPFSFEDNETKVSCSKDGVITLTHEVTDSNEFDEIEVPASLIFKIAMMLENTRKIHWIPKEDK